MKAHFVRAKTKVSAEISLFILMTSWKKESSWYGSRIRERDKKNVEYYVGDYLDWQLRFAGGPLLCWTI